MRRNCWAKFKKVADAIRTVELAGASVKWNSRLNGQRFDAVLSSTYEGQEFLLVVDCVDHGATVQASVVRGFGRKVDQSGAQMGVMVSASDYDQEAFKLSAEYSVALVDWNTVDLISEDKLAAIFKPALLVYNFRFVPEHDASQLVIPEEPPLLRFLMRKIRITGPGIDICPEELVNGYYEQAKQDAVCRPKDYVVPLPPGTVLIHPNFRTNVRIKAFAFTYRIIPQAEVRDWEAVFEDHYGVTKKSLREEMLKRNAAADQLRIGEGFDTVLRPTKYYYNPQLQFSYYCEAVTKGQARVVLVESYQNGNLMQARFTVSRDQYSQYVEVTDSGEIDRLRKLYDTFAVSDKNLEERFKIFLRSLPGTESVDELVLTREQQEAQRADYFLANRTIIGELKALYEDTTSKMEAILAPYRETPEWPIFFGEQELEKILQHLPDRDRIRATIFRAVTRSIEAVVEKANRQIRETKRTFDLPESGGLLIIVNDAVDILAPDLVMYRVRRALNKRTKDGKLRYEHVSAVMVIGGAHYTQLKPDLKGIPILIIPNGVPQVDRVEAFIGELNRKWAAFEQVPFIPLPVDNVTKLTFKASSADRKEAARPLTRQDYWSLLYKRNPYLRSLSEDALLAALEEVAARMIKGAPQTPFEQMESKFIRWSNFLDEVNHRGTDMRKLVQKTEGLGERMEALYQHYQEENNSEVHKTQRA